MIFLPLSRGIIPAFVFYQCFKYNSLSNETKMKILQILLGILLGVTALAMPVGSLSAQQLWKTCWSPDGRSIAFGKGPDIWMIAVDGGDAVNMTEEISEECSCPAFSTDGTEVFYSALQLPNDMFSGGRRSDICAMNLATGKTRTVLENAYAAAFSSDGRFVSYIKSWVNNAVYDFQTGEEHVYDFYNTGPPYFCGGHSFLSPDNMYFISRFEYANNTPLWNRYKLYRVAIDSGEAEMIEIGEKNYVYPKYSPDGSKLLFSQAGAEEGYQLVIYDISAGGVSIVDDSENVETKCGSWSPDASMIVYVRNDAERSELYLYDVKQGNSRPLYPASAVDVVHENELSPLAFSLDFNYPNPFNPSTTIAFHLQKAGEVSVDIYNIKGQKIRELVSGYRHEGVHTLIWNGCDKRGVPVSSGVYICRLLMGDQVLARQMMLAK